MAKRYTKEDLKMMEQLHNEGFSDKEIGLAIGRTAGSVGVQFAYKRKEMNLIDRTEARRLRKLREANTVARVIEIAAQEPQRAPVRPKQSIWDRMIGFFG
jgi:hypothetical protein